jgi:hypothetical protein
VKFRGVLGEVGYGGTDCINPAQDRNQWSALMKTPMKLEILEYPHNWWLLK